MWQNGFTRFTEMIESFLIKKPEKLRHLRTVSAEHRVCDYMAVDESRMRSLITNYNYSNY